MMCPLDEISGLAMNKLLDTRTGCNNKINVKFIRKTGFVMYVSDVYAYTVMTLGFGLDC